MFQDEASHSQVSSSSECLVNNHVVEDAVNINKSETLKIQLGLKRPSCSSDGGWSPKIRKVSENGIQKLGDTVSVGLSNKKLSSNNVELPTSTASSNYNSIQLTTVQSVATSSSSSATVETNNNNSSGNNNNNNNNNNVV